MSAILLDGKELAKQIERGLKDRVAAVKERGICPKLSVVLVGDDPASASYVKSKEKSSARIGIASEVIRLGADTTQGELLTIIHRLNNDETVHGILVQLPLPDGLDEYAAIRAIDPAKDVDGQHPYNTGLLSMGLPSPIPCTPKGIIYMLDSIGYDLKGKTAVVIGRSNIVGKPIAQLLLARNATVTICHSRTRDLPGTTRGADVLVAAVGRAGMVTAEYVKPGAVVIDVGINRVDGKVVGDVDFDGVSEVAGWITPVPGGVGKMTVAMLMENVIECAQTSSEIGSL